MSAICYTGIRVKARPTVDETTAAIIDCIAKGNRITVDAKQLESETELLRMELSHQLQYAQLTGSTSLTSEEIQTRFASLPAEAERQLRAQTVIDAIIAGENFPVTEEELEAEASAIALQQGTTLEMVKGFLPLSSLRRDLLIRKALSFVYDHAVIE